MNRIRKILLLLIFAPACFGHDAPPVPEPMGLSRLLNTFGWDMSKAEITHRKITDHLYVLFGLGGNIAVSLGDDGVLIVDDQFPELIPDIRAEIQRLGGGKVDFAINTHWHFDHAEGNLTLGPEGTWLVSQANSREMMKADHVINLVGAAYDQKAYPESAWPSVTFDSTMQFHFNGERIDLMHFGPAHTTGDTAVIFRGSNAVHLGDVYNNAGYPFIDAGNGGTLDGVIAFCSRTLAEIDEKTVVIPGHGPVADYQALSRYIEMLKTVRGRLVALIEDGATLKQIQDAGVTAEWDDVLGDPSGFVNRSWWSLTHRYVDR